MFHTNVSKTYTNKKQTQLLKFPELNSRVFKIAKKFELISICLEYIFINPKSSIIYFELMV